MTTIGSPPGTFPGTFACDAGSLKELLANATLSCPCCNGPLTPEKLARLLDDVQKLAQGAGGHQRRSNRATDPAMLAALPA